MGYMTVAYAELRLRTHFARRAKRFEGPVFPQPRQLSLSCQGWLTQNTCRARRKLRDCHTISCGGRKLLIADTPSHPLHPHATMMLRTFNRAGYRPF
jgi:hypothetical protein